jgi:hypothetical protein
MAYIGSVVACLVFILGCLGNGTLIFLIAKHKQLKTTRNAFILNIAVADMLAAVICAPIMGVTAASQDDWLFGEAICRLYYFTLDLFPEVSIFTLTVLSIERCINRFSPSRTPETMRRGVAVGIIVILWFISVIIDLRQLIFATLKTTYSGGGHVCFVDGPSHLRHVYQALDTAVRFVVQFAIPVLIIALCFTSIAIKRSLGSGGTAQPTTPTSRETRPHAEAAQPQTPPGTCLPTDSSSCYTKLVLAFVIVFIVCFLPLHIWRIWFYFGRTDYSVAWNGFRIFANNLSYVDCCIRAWIVFGIDPIFNHYFKKHLCCCCNNSSTEDIIPLDDQTVLPAHDSFNYAEKEKY